MMKPGKNNRGFSLIEVMIALIIISVGMLGIAALQATGLQFNAISAQRSIAAMEITNFIAKMRANICGIHNTDPAKLSDIGAAYSTCSPTADNAFSYANYTSENPLPGVPADVPVAHTAITDPSNTCTTSGTPCDSKTQAQSDLWTFSQTVASNLNGGLVRVSCNDDKATATANDCTNSSTYRVSIFWQEAALRRDAGGQKTGQYVTKQFTMVFKP